MEENVMDPSDLQTLARRWQASADEVFATAMRDPETYVRATRLVGAVVVELRTRGNDADSLLGAWREHRDIVRQVASGDSLLTTEGLDPTAVGAAAFAMRHREVAHHIQTAARLKSLSRLPSDAWSVLEESGYAPGDPFVPYRRLEVHPASGRALLVTTAPNETFSDCTHQVQSLSLDVGTGEITAPQDNGSGVTVEQFASQSDREARVTALKAAAGAAGPPAR